MVINHSLLIWVAALLAVSGCLGMQNLPSSVLVPLTENPEQYYGENVTVAASPLAHDTPFPFAYYIQAEGNDGEMHTLDVNYTGFGCSKCLLTGVVQAVSMCRCQSASCTGQGCTVSNESSWKDIDVRFVSGCENKTASMVFGILWRRNLFRCAPGSKTGLYYLQVDSAVPAAK